MRAVPDMVSRWLPPDYVSLGTDGFGRSDTREALRTHFEIDPPAIAAAALYALSRSGAMTPRKAAKAIADLGLDPDRAAPFSA
jgi:pyruvate dehydrogenase E1 component